MELTAEKAVLELSWDSIQYLFRPQTIGELLLRIDYEGMKKAFYQWAADSSPDAMPHRFRGPHVTQFQNMLAREMFYRQCCRAAGQKPRP